MEMRDPGELSALLKRGYLHNIREWLGHFLIVKILC